jgi:DNA-binding transcriptional LysR family regulator
MDDQRRVATELRWLSLSLSKVLESNMEMHQVRYFLALCDERSFTRAARRCGVAQPSLTNAIKRLEQELGGLLFRRDRGNIRPSELGRVVQPHLKMLDRCAQDVMQTATNFSSLSSV